MQQILSVEDFIKETIEDFNSPITSTFVSRIPQIKKTVNCLDESLESDFNAFYKVRKAIKAFCNSGKSHVESELCFSTCLDSLGNTVLDKDPESSMGLAFKKFAIVTKELSNLMKTLMQNFQNSLLIPVDILLKNDLNGVKHVIKRPFEKACKDYETKYQKIEKEKKHQAKEVGLIRSEVTSAEIADEIEKERKIFQLQMCEYLMKYNELKAKKGIDLLQHLIDYFHAQTSYFQDGLKTIEYFVNYINELNTQLQNVRKKQDDERKKLIDVKYLIQSSQCFEKDSLVNIVTMTDKNAGYSLHQFRGDKQLGVTKSGYLFKKSDRKMMRVWQRRRCFVRCEGFLEVYHADETKVPNRVNLLICQIKMVPDDKRSFDLVSYNRIYHFQADDDIEQHLWVSIIANCKEAALKKVFDGCPSKGENHSLVDLQKSVISYIIKYPGNECCCDCSSTNDSTWLSTNLGIIVCIECSGIHRDLGVHVSRIQSLILDNVTTSQLLIARFMGNQTFNEVIEQKLLKNTKLSPSSTMDERYSFVRAKYIEKRFVAKISDKQADLLNYLEKAISEKNFINLLKIYAHNIDMSLPLPNYENKETALHLSVRTEEGNSLHIVDFIIQNVSSQALNKQTDLQPNSNYGLNTALHLSAQYDRFECMKLLLLRGADYALRNSDNKTPLDIAYEFNHYKCIELLEKAMSGNVKAFDNINVNWNLSSPEDDYVDFSDDETVINESLKLCFYDRKSLPSSDIGNESPLSIRSRSSTCENLRFNSSINLNSIDTFKFGLKQPIAVNAMKKKAAPLPPPTLPPLSLPVFTTCISPPSTDQVQCKYPSTDMKTEYELPSVNFEDPNIDNKSLSGIIENISPSFQPSKKNDNLSDVSCPIPPPRKVCFINDAENGHLTLFADCKNNHRTDKSW